MIFRYKYQNDNQYQNKQLRFFEFSKHIDFLCILVQKKSEQQNILTLTIVYSNKKIKNYIFNKF